MSPGLWYREVFEDRTSLGLRVEASLLCESSEFQHIEVLETTHLGKVLVLDGVFMTSEADEFYYHEMIVHPALVTAPSIERVLIIGGGDGGTAREVLRHPGVRECVMVEIDAKVVEACKAHMPEIAKGAWDDPRLTLRFEDGVRYLREADAGRFDVVILDGSDPVGPAKGLFDRSFYESARRVLGERGVFALQSESPTVYPDVFFGIQETLGEVFGAAHPYFGSVFLYGAGMWTWTYASASAEPLSVLEPRLAAIEAGCRYYNGDIHRACFAQPSFVRARLRPGAG